MASKRQTIMGQKSKTYSKIHIIDDAINWCDKHNVVPIQMIEDDSKTFYIIHIIYQLEGH